MQVYAQLGGKDKSRVGGEHSFLTNEDKMLHYICARERSPCTYDTNCPKVLSSIRQAEKEMPTKQLCMNARTKYQTLISSPCESSACARNTARCFYVPEDWCYPLLHPFKSSLS